MFKIGRSLRYLTLAWAGIGSIASLAELAFGASADTVSSVREVVTLLEGNLSSATSLVCTSSWVDLATIGGALGGASATGTPASED